MLKLKADGFFKRNYLLELIYGALIFAFCISGTYLAPTYPLLASILIGIGMQQGMWHGHDHHHARNSAYCDVAKYVYGGWINGLDHTWWSIKHNSHHVHPNHKNIDPDIHHEPYLYVFAPPKHKDQPLRRWQHYYVYALTSLLIVNWRIKSLKLSVSSLDFKSIIFGQLPFYAWMLLLPWPVFLGSWLVSGVAIANVVAISHESEEIIDERDHSYVRSQFRTTRDAICPDGISVRLHSTAQHGVAFPLRYSR